MTTHRAGAQLYLNNGCDIDVRGGGGAHGIGQASDQVRGLVKIVWPAFAAHGVHIATALITGSTPSGGTMGPFYQSGRPWDVNKIDPSKIVGHLEVQTG